MSVILFGTGKLSNTKNEKSIFKYKLHGVICFLILKLNINLRVIRTSILHPYCV